MERCSFPGASSEVVSPVLRPRTLGAGESPSAGLGGEDSACSGEEVAAAVVEVVGMVVVTQ
jgi:hypothetical protein